VHRIGACFKAIDMNKLCKTALILLFSLSTLAGANSAYSAWLPNGKTVGHKDAKKAEEKKAQEPEKQKKKKQKDNDSALLFIGKGSLYNNNAIKANLGKATIQGVPGYKRLGSSYDLDLIVKAIENGFVRAGPSISYRESGTTGKKGLLVGANIGEYIKLPLLNYITIGAVAKGFIGPNLGYVNNGSGKSSDASLYWQIGINAIIKAGDNFYIFGEAGKSKENPILSNEKGSPYCIKMPENTFLRFGIGFGI